MRLRGYEGTGVQGYMPHHRLRTLHTQAQTRSPAARSSKPPLPPHLCKRKAGRPRQASALLVFLGSWRPQEGVVGGERGRGTGGEQRPPSVYVGSPRLVQWPREGVTAARAMFGLLGTCHKRGTGRAASPHRPNNQTAGLISLASASYLHHAYYCGLPGMPCSPAVRHLI